MVLHVETKDFDQKKTRRIKSIKDGKVRENRYVMDCAFSSLMVLTRRLSLCLSGGRKKKRESIHCSNSNRNQHHV